ncbi:MAG: hypothetical protein JWO36_4684 [Myxococcales bacterium]|nr:hypothetical protein [Myxococcales bacterium]
MHRSAKMRIVAVIVLTVLAGCVGSTVGSSDCHLHLTKTLTIDGSAQNDPPLQLRIESCRLDVDACMTLCDLSIRRAAIIGTVTHCDVTFEGTAVTMQIAYDAPNPDNVCEAF